MDVEPRGSRLEVEIPQTRRERMRGLLGRESMAPGRALMLERTRSVHTVGMRFPLAVALLDRDLRVLQIRRVPPNRLVLPRRRTRHVLELGADEDLRVGDRLRRQPS
jgi:uncharacterized membrane protein (UPF0127 family)